MKPQMNADERIERTPPPLAGGGRGRGRAPEAAIESIRLESESDEQTRNDTELSARFRAETPPPTPSRKGRGSFLYTIPEMRESAFIPSYRRSSAFPFFSVNLCVSVPLWFNATGAMPPICIRNDG
jgi:hypothetical protein